jgi:gustatory receptor
MHTAELKGSLHEAIGPVLKVAQVFGLMPIDGVMSKDVENLEFKWKSFKTMYTLVFLVLGTAECLLCCRLIFKKGLTLSLSSELSFYLISMIGAFYILKLATKWKYLMKVWFDSEKVFLKSPYVNLKLSMKRKIRLWAALIGFLSLCK